MDKQTFILEINALKENPLFNFSLGARELFHSDFLAWLFNLDKKFLCRFLSELGYKISNDETIQNIFREHNNKDIIITTCTNAKVKQRFIIENKVKAPPMRSN